MITAFIIWYIMTMYMYISVRSKTFSVEDKIITIGLWIVFFPIVLTLDLAECVNKILKNDN